MLLAFLAAAAATLSAQAPNVPHPASSGHAQNTVSMGEPLGGYQVRRGLWLSGGPGYDFRVARGVSITPFGSWSAVRTEDNGDTMAADIWQAGLWLTLH